MQHEQLLRHHMLRYPRIGGSLTPCAATVRLCHARIVLQRSLHRERGGSQPSVGCVLNQNHLLKHLSNTSLLHAECPYIDGYDFYPLQMVSKAMTVAELPGYIESGATFDAIDAGQTSTDAARLASQAAVVTSLRKACDANGGSGPNDDGTALICNAFNTFGEVSHSPGWRSKCQN